MGDHLDTLDLAALAREAERLGYVRDADDAEVVAWRGRSDGPSIVRHRRGWACWAWELGQGDEADAIRWLLRQPEALARVACYARGVADGIAGTPEVRRG